MTSGFDMDPQKRRRHAVDPSLGYWLGPSIPPEDYSPTPTHGQTLIIPYGAPAVDSNSLSGRSRTSDGGQLVEHPFAYNIQTNDIDGLLLGNPPQHPISDSAQMVDEECTRTFDRAPPLLPCLKKAPSVSLSPQDEPGAPLQRNTLTVEQFLRAQSRARKPAKRRNYKKRPKATIKSDLERLKEADSSFAREEDQLFSDGAEPPALQTKRRRKTQAASDHQTARMKSLRTRKTEEMNAIQPSGLRERPLPNIATRSLHERWHSVDSRKGRPFIQPTFASRRHRVSLGPLKPVPVLPLIRTGDDISESALDIQNLPLTTKVSERKARRSARIMLSMEPTEEHEKKLKSWRSTNVQELSLGPLQPNLNDVKHGGTARASQLVHSPKTSSETNRTVPGRSILGRVNISDSTPSTSKYALRPTEAPKPTTNAEITFTLPAAPRPTAIIDRDQGDQSVVLVEDSFLDIDEPERVSRPPTAYHAHTFI